MDHARTGVRLEYLDRLRDSLALVDLIDDTGPIPLGSTITPMPRQQLPPLIPRSSSRNQQPGR